MGIDSIIVFNWIIHWLLAVLKVESGKIIEKAAEEESEPLFSVGQKVENVWSLNCNTLPEFLQEGNILPELFENIVMTY